MRRTSISGLLGLCLYSALALWLPLSSFAQRDSVLISRPDTIAARVWTNGHWEKRGIARQQLDDPLNGVSTFDLVLINKHILGLELLNSPYKMIAADAYKDNFIKTSDIVWLKRLILGIVANFDTLNHNTSWRFIEAGYQFANSANPFQDTTNWPQTVDVYPNFSNNPVDTVDFTAIKVGDVNGNASTGCSAPNQRPAAKPALPLSLGTPGAAARGEYLTLPLRYDGPEALEAFQLGLRFDPARLELIGPSRGDARGYTAANFNLAQAKNGEIRTLWLADPLDEDNRLLPGQTLFYLTFRVLQSVESEAAALLQTDEGLLGSLAWTAADAEYALTLQARPAAAQPRSAEPPAALRVTPQPNPTTGAVTFQIESGLAGKAHFSLFGPFGNRVYYREAALERGPNALSVPETAGLAPGVYIWQVRLGGQKTEGRIVKQ